MTWPVYPMPAGVAVRQPHLGLDPRPAILIVGEYGPAAITAPTLRSGTPASTDLTARAVRMSNRDRKAAAAYLATHLALASRIYGGATE